MSWHYLQGQEVASWEGSSLDGIPSVLLKLIPLPEQFFLQDKKMECSIDSQFGMISQPSMGIDGKDLLTLLPEDFHVKTYPRQVKARELGVNVLDCGTKWQESFLKFNPNTCWWKTAHCLFPEDLTSCWLILPKWGLMRNGELSAQRTPRLHTRGKGYGLWPTPRCWMKHGAIRKKTEGSWSKGINIEDLCGGKPDPNLVEWMMDWPMGWTDLKPLEMDRFQKWLDLHGDC